MGLLSILIETVGSGIAKGILNIWLEENNYGKEIGKNVVNILAKKTNDVIANRSGSRQFDQISEKIALNLLHLFESVGPKISDKKKEEIAQLAGQAINKIEQMPGILSKNNLDPILITSILHSEAVFPNEESPLIHYTKEEKFLYDRVISESAQYLVDIATNLPGFTEKTFEEILQRQDLILDKAEVIINEVKNMQVKNESADEQVKKFESDYKRLIVRKLDILELFGVDLSHSSKRYQLSTAYVRMSVNITEQDIETNIVSKVEQDYENTNILAINEAINDNPKLLLIGAAGTGKTTLLKWIAVKAAGHSFKEGLKEWNDSIPFFIRLREFSDKKLPPINEWPNLISEVLAPPPSDEWIVNILTEGKAIVLIDGVDEIKENQRENVKNWIIDIVEMYPKSKVIVSSRPYAVNNDWLTEYDFKNADLQDMNLSDIDLFIAHWHETIKQVQYNSDEKIELDKLALQLKNTIRNNRNLLKLATNPLLCALICAVHRDRSSKLPSDRIELYKVCIDMFFRRDKERFIEFEEYIDIGDRQKKALLSDFAYWLIKNGWSEIDIKKADERFHKKLKSLKDLPAETDGKNIRKYFVERSGILRQPTNNTIDFPHRTFEEFLAAQAIVEEGDFGVLLKNVTNDQWREVIQLACGLARASEANDLIKKIINDSIQKDHANLYLLAAACIDSVIEVDNDTLVQVQKKLKKLIPPNSITSAKRLASAGDIVVPFLKYKKNYNAKQLASCVRTLALIGGNGLDILKDYGKDDRKSVADALIDGLKYTKNQEEYLDKINFKTEYIYISSKMPWQILEKLPDLTYLRAYTDQGISFESFLKLKKLKRLSFDFIINRATIKAIGKLKTLKYLSFTSYNTYDIVESTMTETSLKTNSLSSLTNIEELEITANIDSLEFLKNRTKLRELTIKGKIIDFNKSIILLPPTIKHLGLSLGTDYNYNLNLINGFKKLESLNLYILDSDFFKNAQYVINLSTMDSLKNIRIDIYTYTQEKYQVKYPSELERLVIYAKNNNGFIPGIKTIRKIKSLVLNYDRSMYLLTNLAFLENLIDLEKIHLNNIGNKCNLKILSKFKNLEEVRITYHGVIDISPLFGLKKLRTVIIKKRFYSHDELLSHSKLLALKAQFLSDRLSTFEIEV